MHANRRVVVKIMAFLGTLNIRCRIIMEIQKGAIILTTTQELCAAGFVRKHMRQ